MIRPSTHPTLGGKIESRSVHCAQQKVIAEVIESLLLVWTNVASFGVADAIVYIPFR
jgi:hypothetical protein